MCAQTTVQLLEADPDLAAQLSTGSRLRAGALSARLIAVPKGIWHPPVSGSGYGLLLLDGLLLRRVAIDGRPAAELLGEGDLIRPWQASATLGTVVGEQAVWLALTPVHVAVIDDAVSRQIAVFPELSVALVERATRRTRALALTMAIAHQVRIDIRVHLLLWLLADRWGRVRPEGVFLPLRLTHEILGELVGAQRATVTTGLAKLSRAGLVTRTPKGYELYGEPPGRSAGDVTSRSDLTSSDDLTSRSGVTSRDDLTSRSGVTA